MRYLTHLSRSFAIVILGLAGLMSLPAQAGIVIAGTRTVYHADDREVTIKLTNDDKKFPRLVQAWVDDGDEKISLDKLDVPFTLTPPVFRVEPGKSQAIRMVYTKEPLATDKETLFWLNVLEVPPKVGEEDENQLRFAFRIRTKIFFRPAKLAMKPEDARNALTWSLVKDGANQVLEVRNPSPYYVSFQKIALAIGEKEIDSPDYAMVAPGGTQRYMLKDAPATLGADAKVKFSIVDDFGAFIPVTSPLTAH
ncbi:fimbrial biogenesis chaperone [Collimonas antrihumi]|uniref:fimbrial biogenesis chaperone n=1 Tax=Collimonas antrihumi TaxID=1940615 RepID=UPI001B8ADC07|nr:molecular chaperone [Collimonas antrihumi]